MKIASFYSLTSFLSKNIVPVMIIILLIVVLVFALAIFKITRTYNEKIYEILRSDRLTEKYNLNGFEYQLNRIKKINRWSMICFDVNSFKQVNNELGFDYGDEVIRQIAKRVDGILNEHGILARIESNRFILAYPYKSDNPIASKIVTIKDSISSITIDDTTVLMEFTFGIYNSLENEEISVSIKKVIEAWIYAKKNELVEVIYGVDNVTDEVNLSTIAGEMNQAIENDEFTLLFTPRVNVMSGKIMYASLHTAWYKNGKVFFNENEYIDAFKKNDLIHDFDLFVLENVAKTLKIMQTKKLPMIPIVLKLSLETLKKNGIFEEINTIIYSKGLSTNSIIIEFDEKEFLYDSKAMSEIINKLKENGFTISIDNFGKKKSVFSTLYKYDAETICLDEFYASQGFIHENDKKVLDIFTNALGNNKAVIKGVAKLRTIEYLRTLDKVVLVEGPLVHKELTTKEFFDLILEDSLDLLNLDEKPQPKPSLALSAPQEVVEKQPEERVLETRVEPQIIQIQPQSNVTEERIEAIIYNVLNKSNVTREINQDSIELMVRRIVMEVMHKTEETNVTTESKEQVRVVETVVEKDNQLSTSDLENAVRNVIKDYLRPLGYEQEKSVVEIHHEESTNEEESLLSLLEKLLPRIDDKNELDNEELEVEVEEDTLDTKEEIIQVEPKPEADLDDEEDDEDDEDDDEDEDNIDSELQKQIDSKLDINQFQELLKQYMADYRNSDPLGLNLTEEQKKWLPFIERINLSTKEVKSYYNMIKNAIMENAGIQNKITKRYDTFKVGRKILFKIAYVGKTLKIFLPLNPTDYPPAQFPHKDMSDVIKHRFTPYMMKVRSNLGLKRALILIKDSMIKLGLEKDPTYKNADYVARNRNQIQKSMNQ